MEKVMMIFWKGPYGQINSLEGIRIAQGLLVLDVDVKIAFIEDGVFNLVKNQKPNDIGHHSIISALEAARRYDIPFYAIDFSLKIRGIKEKDIDPNLNVKIISIDEFRDLILQVDTTISL